MKNVLVRCIPLLALLFLPGALAAAQVDTHASSTTHTVRYDIQFLDLHAAEVLAWDQCVQKENCRVTTVSQSNNPNRKGYLEVDADPFVHEKIARALAKADAGPQTRNLQILLLSAALKPGTATPEIPENARKALAEVRKFLPFKSYQLVDAAWMRVTEGEGAQGRLGGAGGGAYQVKLRFQRGDQETPSLFFDHFELSQEMVVQTKDGPHYDVRRLIDTTLNVKVGETVVVGTSKADGADGALVVLLTAVPTS
ncbi:MAG TPA: hypothetical protein VGH73_16595 [Thermoanaerobaculia bacterium]|jgi:hypothetical protein